MDAPRICDWILLASLVAMACLGLGRAMMLRRRKVRVVPSAGRWWPLQVLILVLLFGVILVYAYEIVAFAWPLSFHLVSPSWNVPVLHHAALPWLGAIVVGAGVTLYGMALASMGDSWRMGVDLENPGALVTHGIFAWSRNPIYLAFDLLLLGVFLVLGRSFFLWALLAVGGTLHVGILVEEKFLARLYGDPYRAYCSRVRRYWGRRTFP